MSIIAKELVEQIKVSRLMFWKRDDLPRETTPYTSVFTSHTKIQCSGTAFDTDLFFFVSLLNSQSQ